jgi:hypothetical protein
VPGLVREKELSSDPKSPVEEAMRNGPATFRPNEPVGKMAKRIPSGMGQVRPEVIRTA